jgi:hypothetical protein
MLEHDRKRAGWSVGLGSRSTSDRWEARKLIEGVVIGLIAAEYANSLPRCCPGCPPALRGPDAVDPIRLRELAFVEHLIRLAVG